METINKTTTSLNILKSLFGNLPFKFEVVTEFCYATQEVDFDNTISIFLNPESNDGYELQVNNKYYPKTFDIDLLLENYKKELSELTK